MRGASIQAKLGKREVPLSRQGPQIHCAGCISPLAAWGSRGCCVLPLRFLPALSLGSPMRGEVTFALPNPREPVLLWGRDEEKVG